MKRDLPALADAFFDLVIIGGGIYGAALAWEAASRGLSVALLEKGDFAGATSANSLKIIHGGFRYLQRLDLGRMRTSMLERRALMQIAPHLVHPLPVLVPTRGHGLKSRELLALGLVANEVLSLDRNRPAAFRRQVDPQKWIPAGRLAGRREVLRRLPALPAGGLTGGIIFYDAQVYDSERLVLAFLHSAANAGAILANYVEADGLLHSGGRVYGVQAVDRRPGGPGDRFEVRGRMTVNAAGPWAGQMLAGLLPGSPVDTPLALALNVIVRPLFADLAVGLLCQDCPTAAGSSAAQPQGLLFASPWRGASILGTTYRACSGSPDISGAGPQDIQGLLEAFNRAYPPASLRLEDVALVHAGLLPRRPDGGPGGRVRLLERPQLRDHRADGVQGLLSVVGVKYTTARGVARQAVDAVYRQWGSTPPPSRSAESPLHGGEIDRFEDYLQDQVRLAPCGLDAGTVRALVMTYGSAYPEALRWFDEAPGDGPAQKALASQVLYGVREEMAVTLADSLFRRTGLASAGRPPQDEIELAARVMAAELGWTPARAQAEIEAVEHKFKGLE